MKNRLLIYATGKAYFSFKPYTILPATLDNFHKIMKIKKTLEGRGLLPSVQIEKGDIIAPIFDLEDFEFHNSRTITATTNG